MFGPQTRQLLCVVGWGDKHDARKICTQAANADYGLYGFSKPNPDSLPLPVATYLSQPLESFKGNDRNFAVLAHVFNGKPLPEPVKPPVKASSVWGPGYEADKAFDGDETTRWGAAPNSRSGWLEIDLGKEKPVGRATVMELGFHRTQEFVIEHKAGDEWKPLYHGTTCGETRVQFSTSQRPLRSPEHPQSQRSAHHRGVPTLKLKRGFTSDPRGVLRPA